MKVLGVGLLAVLCVAVGCGGDPGPTATPVVCESNISTFEKKGIVHDDYQGICIEDGGYYLYLTLRNNTDEPFRLSLLQGDKDAKVLYEVGRKSLDDAAVYLLKVCPSDCDATQGQVQIEVDAPDDPADVEWAVRVEKKIDST